METTKKHVRNELHKRLSDVQDLVRSAHECFMAGDWFQCAVRLQELEKIGKFSDFEMNVFESLSEE